MHQLKGLKSSRVETSWDKLINIAARTLAVLCHSRLGPSSSRGRDVWWTWRHFRARTCAADNCEFSRIVREVSLLAVAAVNFTRRRRRDRDVSRQPLQSTPSSFLAHRETRHAHSIAYIRIGPCLVLQFCSYCLSNTSSRWLFGGLLQYTSSPSISLVVFAVPHLATPERLATL